MRYLALLLLALTPCLAADKNSAAHVQEKFAPGGFIRLHLSPGGYKIIDGDANAIVVTCNASNPDQLSRVKVKIRTSAASADVFISDTPHNNFQAIIEVPARSDLRVRVLAGEVVITGIEGDKDVEVEAGRIEIGVPQPDDYGRRDASVHAGSIEAAVFHISKGGLFRSFEQKGPGKYRLHAHVATGEIDLRQTP
jgi:hypothetical protein